MKRLFSYFGGSRAYGIDGPESDLDLRYLFIHEDISHIIGLDRQDHQQNREGGKDEFGWELRHFLNLCRKANTQALEALFLPKEKYLSTSYEWETIIANRDSLLDSKKTFKCILGYAQGEKNLVTGNRSGALGEKRKTAIEKYGYSYKNLSHLFRLLICGIKFFKSGYFPVDITKEDYCLDLNSDTINPAFIVKDIKFNPHKYTLSWGLEVATELESELKRAFDLRLRNFEFDEKIANDLCHFVYMPILVNYTNDIKSILNGNIDFFWQQG